LDAAKPFIEARVLGSYVPPDETSEHAVTDYKSALQEMAQAKKLPPPRYVIVAEDGPEHSKTFTVEVRVGKEFVSRAQGMSKKAAGQMAAQLVLEKIAAAR